ncbi:MAG: MAP kinase kinase (MEK) [Cirrosporium novae-zelandiae]|nr:MAG: MAP kinase kinase (MEK) [Cirrosporium novae-zelandiae]
MSDNQPFKVRTMKRKNVKGLALNAAPPKSLNQNQSSFYDDKGSAADTLEIGVEFKLDLKSEDLVLIKELGAGNGGTVSKVKHASTNVVMARKVGQTTPRVALKEHAKDVLSLEGIFKQFGPVRVDVLGKISEAILQGLCYLYEEHRIMHRDIKPSNVLVNSRGQIKLCDFGVSAEIVNSIAETFVGTSTYMAPERIQGAKYSIKSDVWSFGLTVFTLALAKFPFDSNDSTADERVSSGPMGILDLLQQIVHEPAPRLPECDAFPPILYEFVDKCLLKNPDQRPSPRELLSNDMFIKAARRTPVDLHAWAVSMMERNNRKSHLGPPPPSSLKVDGFIPHSSNSDNTEKTITPSTSNYTPRTGNYTPHTANYTDTPTSGEIPIAGEGLKISSPPTNYPHPTITQEPSSIGIVKSSTMPLHKERERERVRERERRTPPTMDRPHFPPRTSSASMIHPTERREHPSSNYPPSIMSLPIRPAPPPSAPLPMPPQSRSPLAGLRTASTEATH